MPSGIKLRVNTELGKAQWTQTHATTHKVEIGGERIFIFVCVVELIQIS